MKYFALFIGILMIIPAFGQKKKGETVAPTFKEGVIYSLPRTGIRVNVKAVKVYFQPGPYAAYAEQLLGIKNAKSKASVSWIIEDVKIEQFSEPDPEQTYKAMGNGAFVVNLTSDGCLAGINSTENQSKKSEIVTNRSGQISKPDKPDFFQYFTDTPQYSAGDSTNNYRPVKVPEEQKITKAAQRILESRRLRYEIAAGMADELPPDGDAYKESLKQLEESEKEYLGLFVGKTSSESAVFAFDYIPKATGKSEAIFRISDENGIVPATDLSGKPVMIEFEIDKELAQKQGGLIKSDNPAAGESGIFYRVPGRANIKIVNDMNVIASTRATVAQFGVVAPIPEELLSGEYSVEFNPESGSVKSIVKKVNQ